MPDSSVLSIDQRIASSSENAIVLARKMFDANLNYSAKSFAELDSIINYFRQQIPKEFDGKQQQDVSMGAILKWGAYFGETMRRLHGGRWIDDVAPVLMIRRLGVQPFLFVGAMITGKTMRVGKREVAATVEYYASLKPVLGEAMGELLRGPEPDEQALAASMSGDPAVARGMLLWLEDALTCAYTESSMVLDFSPESLKAVDNLLDEFQLRAKKEPQRVEFRDAHLSLMFGVYLGETIRRSFGGRWINAQTGSGGINIPLLQLASNHFSPLSLLKARLEQGEAKSLWHAFQGIKQRLGP
jgi:hypothetical protein